MGKFREQKRASIEAGKEKGDAAIMSGEQRVRELQAVKGMIDAAYFRDEMDREQYEALSESYERAGVEAHEREVASVVESTRVDLEQNRQDIVSERENVENAIGRIGDMKGVTDLARSEATNVEKNLRESVNEYQDMESLTEDIESDQEQKSQAVLNKIKSIFG